MLIDPFTVAAQIVNFLILVWLLKRFLYHPILDAIDAREKRIAGELADAQAKQAEAQEERETFRSKNAQFDHDHDALMNQARTEAQAERQRLLDEARQAALALERKRQETLRSEARTLNDSVRHRVQDQVFAIVRKTLTDLAGISVEARMCEVFIARLKTIDATTRADLAKAFQSASEPALVRSALELPQPQRAAIGQALNETFSMNIAISFETLPELVSGIELSAAGKKVAWSIADYLSLLQKGVDEALGQVDPPQATVTQKAGDHPHAT